MNGGLHFLTLLVVRQPQPITLCISDLKHMILIRLPFLLSMTHHPLI